MSWTPFERYLLTKEAGFQWFNANRPLDAMVAKGWGATGGRAGAALTANLTSPAQHVAFMRSGASGKQLSGMQRGKAWLAEKLSPGAGNKLRWSHFGGYALNKSEPLFAPKPKPPGVHPAWGAAAIGAGGLVGAAMAEQQKAAGLADGVRAARRERQAMREKIAYQITRPVDPRGSEVETPSPFPEDVHGHAMTQLRAARESELGALALSRYLRVSSPMELDPIMLAYFGRAISRRM